MRGKNYEKIQSGHLKETFKTLAQENSEKLMAKARQANNLLNLQGKNRRIAYSVKADSLCGLVKSCPIKLMFLKTLINRFCGG